MKYVLAVVAFVVALMFPLQTIALIMLFCTYVLYKEVNNDEEIF